MAEKEELDPGVRLALSQIEVGELIHAGNEGGPVWNGGESVGISLAFHVPGMRVHQRQKHNRYAYAHQDDKGQISEIGESAEAKMVTEA